MVNPNTENGCSVTDKVDEVDVSKLTAWSPDQKGHKNLPYHTGLGWLTARNSNLNV